MNQSVSRASVPGKARRPRLELRTSGVALLVLAAALLFRLVYLAVYARAVPHYHFPSGDSLIYLHWAGSILGGDMWGQDGPFQVFYRAPLYPYILALFRTVFGTSLLPVYLFQFLLGTTSLFLTYLIGRRLFSHRAGLISLILGALYAPLPFKETKLVSVTLIITLLLFSAWLLVRADGSRLTAHGPEPKDSRAQTDAAGAHHSALIAHRYWFLAGLCIGIAALAWGGTILLVPLAFVFWFFGHSRRRLVLPLLLAAGFGLGVLPAAAHNLLAGKDLVLVNSNGGFTFYQGNNPNATGIIAHPPEVFEQPVEGRFPTLISEQESFDLDYASKASGRRLRPSQASAFWFGRALSWIAANPGRYLSLELEKLRLVLSNYEFASNYFLGVETREVPLLALAFMPFTAILAFGLVGIAVSFRERRRLWPLYWLIAGTVLTLLVFYVGSRYRLPLVLPLAVFAGAGAGRILDRWNERKAALPELGLALVVAAVSVFACTMPVGRRYAFTNALGYRNLGDVLQHDARDPGRALAAYTMAVRTFEGLDPIPFDHEGLSDVLTLRGDLHLEEQRYEAAVADFRRALAVFPARSQPLSKLAYAFCTWAGSTPAARTSDIELPTSRALLDTALGYVNRWLELDPNSTDPLALSGDIHLARAETTQALARYRRIVNLAPESGPAYLGLARIHLARSDTARALAAYEALLAADSASSRARVAVADISLARRDSLAALDGYRRAAAHDTLGLEPTLRLAKFHAGRGSHAEAAAALAGLLARLERNRRYKAGVVGSPARSAFIEAKLRLAIARLNLGEWDRAFSEADEVLKLAPGHPTATQLLEGARRRVVPATILWP